MGNKIVCKGPTKNKFGIINSPESTMSFYTNNQVDNLTEKYIIHKKQKFKNDLELIQYNV
jgi:hypothetical protein